MSLTNKLEAAQNELLNVVLIALLEAGKAKNEAGKALLPDQREAALLVVGLMTAIKVLIMQAGELITEMELDDLVD